MVISKYFLLEVNAQTTSTIDVFSFHLKVSFSFLPRDAMQARSMLSCGVCMFVCMFVCLFVSPSVTFVDHVKTNKHIVTFFSLCGSSIILVFQYQTEWRYSNGNPLKGRRMKGV